jgi:very-short-patch-repair endonuclease
MDDVQRPPWHVTAQQRRRARSLRKNLTDAERALWAALRGHHLDGLGFRRQFPIGPFVADFVCLAAKLVIEIDGGQHFSEDGEMRDARRTALIESKGFRVLRFSNRDVAENRDGVLETILAAAKASTPSLTLPRKRERGQANTAAMSAQDNRKT